MDKPDPWKVDAEDRMRDIRPALWYPLGVRVPTPIYHRLDQLCDLLDNAGEHRPSRDLMVAGFLFESEAPTLEVLMARLREFRLAEARRVVLGAVDTTGVMELPRPQGRSS